MTKAFGYIRVSGKSQLDGDGFPRQREAIQAYAAAHGLEIVRVFEERAVPGKTELENRPALQELLAALYANGVRTAIIERLDRLARDIVVQETIIKDMRAHSIELISASEPDLCSDDPSRKLIRQILGAVSEYEKDMIVLKLKGARQRQRAKKGRCEGRKPYGSRDGEQAVISRMYELRTAGHSDAGIAATLNAQGLRPRKASTWSPIVVGRILDRQAPVIASIDRRPMNGQIG